MNNTIRHIEYQPKDRIMLRGFPEAMGANGVCGKVVQLCARLPHPDGRDFSMYIVKFDNGTVRQILGENMQPAGREPELAADFNTIVPWASCAWMPAELNHSPRRPTVNHKLAAVLCWAASCVVSIGMALVVVL